MLAFNLTKSSLLCAHPTWCAILSLPQSHTYVLTTSPKCRCRLSLPGPRCCSFAPRMTSDYGIRSGRSVFASARYAPVAGPRKCARAHVAALRRVLHHSHALLHLVHDIWRLQRAIVVPVEPQCSDTFAGNRSLRTTLLLPLNASSTCDTLVDKPSLSAWPSRPQKPPCPCRPKAWEALP